MLGTHQRNLNRPQRITLPSRSRRGCGRGHRRRGRPTSEERDLCSYDKRRMRWRWASKLPRDRYECDGNERYNDWRQTWRRIRSCSQRSKVGLPVVDMAFSKNFTQNMLLFFMFFKICYFVRLVAQNMLFHVFSAKLMR